MKNKIVNVVLILIIMLFMASCVRKEMQNDTFFTIALGERTVKYGIEEHDQLVWHDGLEFIHLRWLFDVLIYGIYSVLDFVGIYIFVIIMSIIQGMLYYGILNKFTKNKILSFIATIVTMYFNKPEFAARGQIMSFTLFLIEFICIDKLLETNKKIYMFILLIIPILVVNFHASVLPMYFVFYLPYIAEFILSKFNLIKKEDSKIIIEKRDITKLIILMICGLILGLCSPIGLDAYKYMFKVMGGISADFIAELQPVDLMRDIYYTILICIIIGIIGFTKTKIRLTDAMYIIGFLLLSLPTYRCIYFFYLFASICIFRIVNDFISQNNVNLKFIRNKEKNIISSLLLIIITLFSVKNLVNQMIKDYEDTSTIPVNATNYILSNLDIENMRIFNSFNYGSYLEMKGIKVFLDSRSEMYTEEFNHGVTILEDWLKATHGEIHYKEIFEKYEITHVLLEKSDLINIYIQYDSEWENIYEDDVFVIYEKDSV